MKTGRVYTSSIVTKNKFTDKPAALFGLIVIGVYITMVAYWLNSIDALETTKLMAMVKNIDIVKVGVVYVLPICVVFTVSIMMMVMLALAPVIMIHTAFVAFIIGSIAMAIVLDNKLILIGTGIVAIMYAIVFRSIKRASYMIQAVSQIYVVNTMAVLLYAAVTSITLGVVVQVPLAMLHINILSDQSAAIKSLCSLLSMYFILQVGYIGDVYFSRVVFKYMIKKADKKNTSVIASAVKRTLMSFGTVTIATILSLIVLIMRVALDSMQKRSRNNGELGIVIIVAKMVVLFIAAVILKLLEIAVETLNTYVLVYNALYGENYKNAMKGSYETIKTYRGSYGLQSMLVSIVLAVIIVPTSGVLIYGINKYMEEKTIEVEKMGAQCTIALLITVEAMMSGFLAADFILARDKELVYTVFPGIKEKMMAA